MKHKENGSLSVPTHPITFTIDDEPFSFSPLPLCSLFVVEELIEKLQIDKSETRFVISDWFIKCRAHKEVVLRIVAFLTIEGEVTPPVLSERIKFLEQHCTDKDLCFLLICGLVANNLWLEEEVRVIQPEKFGDLANFSKEEITKIPFIKLLKDRRQWQN